MDGTLIGLGAAIILLGLWCAADGDVRVPGTSAWLHWRIRRAEHPVIFWVILGSDLALGLAAVVGGFIA